MNTYEIFFFGNGKPTQANKKFFEGKNQSSANTTQNQKMRGHLQPLVNGRATQSAWWMAIHLHWWDGATQGGWKNASIKLFKPTTE